MADPIKIYQIIANEKLTGEAAKVRYAELEKLADGELNKLLSKSKDFSNTYLGNFSTLAQVQTAKPPLKSATVKSSSTVFNNGIISDDNMGVSFSETKETPKKYTPSQEKELREYALNYLLEASSGAIEEHNSYVKSFGFISADELWHEAKNLANHFDVSSDGRGITTLNEQAQILNDEAVSTAKLAKSKNKKGSFEFNFEKERKVPYSPQSIENFKTTANTYVEITAYKEKADMLKTGISDIKSIIRQENEYKQALKTLKGPARASLTAPKVSSQDKFGEVLLQYCGGDEKLKAEFMASVSGDLDTPEKIEKNLPKILENIEKKTEEEYQKKLGNKTYEQHTSEYQNAYQKAFGPANVKEITESWINTQKMGASFTKTGIVIASTVLLGGSNFAASSGAALSRGIGTQAAGQVMKAGFTTAVPAMNLVMDYSSALTSETGLTGERNEEILNETGASLPYMIFGAYAAGPIGESVKTFLKSSPSVLPNIINKAFSVAPKAACTVGLSAEITADALFAAAIEDGSLADAFKEQGSMDAGMHAANKLMSALAGGRAHGANTVAMENAKSYLKDYKITETTALNGQKTYTVKAPDGTVSNVSKENLLTGLFSAAGEKIKTKNSSALSFKENPEHSVREKGILEGGIKAEDLDEAVSFKSNEPQLGNTPAVNKIEETVLSTRKHLSGLKNAKTRNTFNTLYENILNNTANIENLSYGVRDLSEKIDMIEDESLRAYLLDSVDKLNNSSKKEFKKNFSETLSFVEDAADAINVTELKYSRLDSKPRTIYKTAKEENIWLADLIEDKKGTPENYRNKLYSSTKTIDYEEYNTKYEKFTKGVLNRNAYLNDIQIEAVRDFSENFINENPQVVKNIYDKSYLKQLKPEVAEVYKKIEDEFGVIVFHSDPKVEKKDAQYIYEELKLWKETGKEKNKFPKIIDMDAFDATILMGAGGYTTTDKLKIQLKDLEQTVIGALRHEMTHINDSELKAQNDIEILRDIIKWRIKKLFNEKEWRSELKKGEITAGYINYAMTNDRELKAVASQGVTKNYSPSFKKTLIEDLKTPEHSLELPRHPFFIEPPNIKGIEKYNRNAKSLISLNALKLIDDIKSHSAENIQTTERVFGLKAGENTPESTRYLLARPKSDEGVVKKYYRKILKYEEMIAEVKANKLSEADIAEGKKPLSEAEKEERIKKLQESQVQLVNDLDALKERLTDAHASRIVLKNPSKEEMDIITQQIIDGVKNGEFTVKEIENYGRNDDYTYMSEEQISRIAQACGDNTGKLSPAAISKTSNYTTTQMILLFKNGTYAELQIRGDMINSIAEAEHILYKIREKEGGPPDIEKAYNKLNEPENSGLKKNYDEYIAKWYQYGREKEMGLETKPPVLNSSIDKALAMENLFETMSNH